MSVGTRSTSPSFRWHGLIAGNGECCRCRRRKTPRERKPLEQAGFYIAEAGEEEVSPSPAPHPLTGMQGEEKSVRDVPGLKCQGCPRLFMIFQDVVPFAATHKTRRSRSGAKVEISRNDFQGADLSRRLLHGSVANGTEDRPVLIGTTS